MQTDNPLLDDLARMASGAVGALTGMRAEVEARVRDQLERILARMDLVTREEFEAVRAMAAKARVEQERLETRLAVLEARLESLATKPARPAHRTAAPPAGRPRSFLHSNLTNPARAPGNSWLAVGMCLWQSIRCVVLRFSILAVAVFRPGSVCAR